MSLSGLSSGTKWAIYADFGAGDLFLGLQTTHSVNIARELIDVSNKMAANVRTLITNEGRVTADVTSDLYFDDNAAVQSAMAAFENGDRFKLTAKNTDTGRASYASDVFISAVNDTGADNTGYTKSITFSSDGVVSTELTFPLMTGINWVSRDTSTTNTGNLQDIAWSPTLRTFVAVASTGTNKVITSPDGVNWTGVSVPSQDWRSVTWASGLGLFVAGSGILTFDSFMTSTDGVNWTQQTVADVLDIRDIVWSPTLSLLVAVGESDSLATSADGITWTKRNPPDNLRWQSVKWVEELGIFIAVSSTGAIGNTISSDGINWSSGTLGSHTWWSVEWSGKLNLLVAAGANGRIATSPDGVTWTDQVTPNTDDIMDVVWSESRTAFVAVSSSGTNRSLISNNGINWTEVITSPQFNTWESVVYTNQLDIFVAAASNSTTNQIMTGIGTN